MISFCGNIVELVEKYKVFNDDDFIECNNTNINENLKSSLDIEVYVEKKLISELEEKPLIIIDAVIGEVTEMK